MWGRVAQPRRTIYVSRNREVGVPTERRDGRARHPPYTKIWATSSVVERVTDNDEVGSSILPSPTMQIFVQDELITTRSQVRFLARPPKFDRRFLSSYSIDI